ncbi:Nif11-like leader peptide family natural product precursor [Synechococcus lacustris L1E-Slac]|nr:Nif11-like leader peptide family natural product precursor [Synechococcus lacustris L1E-Slac]
MPEEQLSALLAKLKGDAVLQEKLKGAAELDAVLAIAKEAGFDISKACWLSYQAKQAIELNDEELERVAGGGFNKANSNDNKCNNIDKNKTNQIGDNNCFFNKNKIY